MNTWSTCLALALLACSSDRAPLKEPTLHGDPNSQAPSALHDAPLPAQSPAAEPPPPSVKRPPCSSDQTCNDDETINALWGKCTPLGVCECMPGFELNPRGRCQKPVK
jgi:hypothetical protein